MKPLLAAAFIVLGAVGGVALHAALANTTLAQEVGDRAGAPGPSKLPTLEERKERLGSFQPTNAGKDLALPEAPAAAGLSDKTRSNYEASLRAYYEYRRAGYEHRLRVFEWQLVSTKIIFVVVLVLVFSGIYFAAIQFHHGLRRGSGTKESEQQPEATEFVFSMKEFKVRSPVLGVIVLTLSLAFFYLYLVYVYPIVNVF